MLNRLFLYNELMSQMVFVQGTYDILRLTMSKFSDAWSRTGFL